MNYIVIISDGLRADFALSPRLTPKLHSFWLKHGGWIFKNCYSTSTWTLPVQMSIYTGLLPSHHGLNDITFAHRRQLLAEDPYYFKAPNCKDEDFLMVKLKERGYTCKYFTPYFHYNFLEHTAHHHHNKIIPWDYFYLQMDKIANEPIEKPFFYMMYDLDGGHSPYGQIPRNKKEDLEGHEKIEDGLVRQQPEIFSSKKLRHMVQQQVMQYDEKLSDFLDWFVETGLYKDTALFITADHGESLWEHGWVGHVFNVYEEIIRVPLFVYYPMLIRSNQVEMKPIGAPVSILDLYPTILGQETAGDGVNLYVRRRTRKIFFEFTRQADPKPKERVWQALPSKNTFIRGCRFLKKKFIYTKTMDGDAFTEMYDFSNSRQENPGLLIYNEEFYKFFIETLKEQYEGIEDLKER